MRNFSFWTTNLFCSKLSRVNDILSKLRYFSPIKTCLSAWYSNFYSLLLQGCLAWFYAKEININWVNKLQKHCIWILTFSDFNSHTNDLFARLKLLNAKDVFALNELIFILIILKAPFLKNLRDYLLSITIYSHMKPVFLKYYIYLKGNTTRFGI